MRSFFVIVFMLLSNILYAQYELPVIWKMSTPKQEAGKPVIYQFPDSANKIINSYISNYDSSTSFYIELLTLDDGYKINLFQLSTELANDSISKLSLLLSSTNRYCVINNLKIPIYFNSDIELGYYNFSITGTSLVIYLKREKFQALKVQKYYVAEPFKDFKLN